MRIAIDMDDVLADSTKKALAAFHQEYGFRPSELEIWGKELHQTVPQEYTKKIVSYFFKKGFLRHVPVISDSQEVVRKLYDRHEVFIVSAATEMPYSLEDKYFWLEENFPFISYRRIVFCGDKSIIRADLLIDDRASNFTGFTGRPLLFTAHHNVHENRYERIGSWREIDRLIG